MAASGNERDSSKQGIGRTTTTKKDGCPHFSSALLISQSDLLNAELYFKFSKQTINKMSFMRHMRIQLSYLPITRSQYYLSV